MTLSTIRNNPAKQKKVKTKKQKAIAATCAVAFWLLVWHVVSLCVGSELVLVSPVKVVQTLFTVIPRTVRLSEAPSYGQPILYYDKSNKGCIAYGALVDEILKKNR